jgi:phospholipid/cholesterol/gamma-HCH transport system substrate-binding protein
MMHLRDDRTVPALTGLIVLVVLLAGAAVGIYAANGAFADDYQLRAVTSRAGFGLAADSDVKVRGITVGSVDAVHLQDDGSVEVVLNLRREIRVPETAHASIEPASVFGPKFVDLTLGPDERRGPHLADGDRLQTLVAPTELAETLDAVSTVLDRVDASRVGTILTELARGTDGLGDELGEALDATVDLSSRLRRIQPTLEVLLADANAVSGVLADRAEPLARVATDSQDLLRLVGTEGDALGELLVGTSELSQRVDDVVRAGADDIGPVLTGLGGAAEVLRAHLRQLPEFTAAFRDVTAAVGDTALRWDVGDGRIGAVVRAVVALDPCQLFPSTVPGCGVVGGP